MEKVVANTFAERSKRVSSPSNKIRHIYNDCTKKRSLQQQKLA